MYGTNMNYGLRKAEKINAGKTVTFCIPLISVVGSLNLADDIKIKILPENDQAAVAYDDVIAGEGWEIISAEYMCQIVELSESGMQMVYSVRPFDQPTYIHSSTYKYTNYQMNSEITESFSCPVPLKRASLKSIWLVPRRGVDIASATSFGISSYINPNVASVNYRIGSMIYPNKSISLDAINSTSGYGEAMAETRKAIISLNSVHLGTALDTDSRA